MSADDRPLGEATVRDAMPEPPPYEPNAYPPVAPSPCDGPQPARVQSPADEIMAESHGAVWARGEQSYAHLGVAQSCSPDALHHHMLTSHGLVPTNPGPGSWCRDVERHASVHGVTVRPS